MFDLKKPEDYFGLVHSICKRFIDRGIEYEDLFQIGCLGLVKAAQKYDDDNARFSTYAFKYIIGEIKMFLRDNGMIKISRKVKCIYLKCVSFILKYNQEYNKSPKIHEIAEGISCSTDEIILALESNYNFISLYEKNENDMYLIDSITSGVNDCFTENFLIDDLLMGLDKKSRFIIKYRILYNKTQKELSEMLNISQVQVSRIEKSAKDKLRENVKFLF